MAKALAKRARNPGRLEQLRRNEQKWSRDLMAAGWTALPSIILEKQETLQLDPTDLNILMQLARYWWFKENLPHPSKKTLARSIGVHPRTVQRRIERMERDGYIKREERFSATSHRQETNRYNFDGLIAKVKPFAREAIKARADRKTAEVERLQRKRPALTLVEEEDESA